MLQIARATGRCMYHNKYKNEKTILDRFILASVCVCGWVDVCLVLGLKKWHFFGVVPLKSFVVFPGFLDYRRDTNPCASMHLWRKICYARALIDACTLWGAVGILVSLPTLTMVRCVLRKQSTFRIIANRSKWSSERNLGMQHVKCVSQSCQKQLNMFSKIGEKCGFLKTFWNI